MYYIAKINLRHKRVYPKIAPHSMLTCSRKLLEKIMNSATTLSTSPYESSIAPAPKPENARGLSALLLAAAVAALAVAADQLIETWVDGHLFLAWVMLWAVVFVGSLMLTGTMRRMSARTIARLDQWAAARARVKAEVRLTAMARRDARLQSSINAPAAAASRAEKVAEHMPTQRSFHI